MEEKEVLVKVEGLSKKFCKDLKTSLWYGLKDLYSNFRGNKEERKLRDKEFWAVKDINFELRRGECLGLIGHNGAGKSTLLKILNGLIKPDAGKVTIKGKVGALIELGAGFNPILSGRENIYNNGAVLGFSRQEIKDKLEKMIDFAEIREFIDMPVQNYSSGMKVRLGFAVAAQLEPDVLIIDEVLAVGDLGFVLKCFKTIDNLLPKTAIIFVSHNMPQVSRLCNKIILMERGESLIQGTDVAKAIDLYYSGFTHNQSSIIYTDNSVELEKAEFLNVAEYERGIAQLKWNDELKIYFKFRIKSEISFPRFSISIYDKEQRPLALLTDNITESEIGMDNGIIEFVVKHENLQLSKGIYFINLQVSVNQAPLLRLADILKFQILHPQDIWPPFLLASEYFNYSLENEK